MPDMFSKAFFLESDGRLTVHDIEVDERYKPTESQTLVRVEFSAINPADLRHYYMGLSDFVAGYEWVGTTIEIGPSSPFRVGQQLFGYAMLGDRRPLPQGAHQDYMLADANWTYIVPDGLEAINAVAFPIAVTSSIDALFNMLGFGLSAAGVAGAAAKNEAILIWGGGSNLGQAGVQLARAAGFSPIITTASPRNHKFLKKIGASHCFDYHSEHVVDDIRSALNGKKLRVVYDAVATGLGCFESLSSEEESQVKERYEQSSPAKARRCCDEDGDLKLSAVLPVPTDKDPDWSFPMPYRVRSGVEIPKPRGAEGFFQGMDPEWGNRMHQITRWLLEDGARRWTPPRIRIVKGAEAGIEAIRQAFEGKAGGEKLVIAHPI